MKSEILNVIKSKRWIYVTLKENPNHVLYEAKGYGVDCNYLQITPDRKSITLYQLLGARELPDAAWHGVIEDYFNEGTLKNDISDKEILSLKFDTQIFGEDGFA